jgi:hypothetical protein
MSEYMEGANKEWAILRHGQHLEQDTKRKKPHNIGNKKMNDTDPSVKRG